MPDDREFDDREFDDELDDIAVAWDEAERAAGAALREHLASSRRTDPPDDLARAAERLHAALLAGDPDATWMRRGAGVGEDLAWPSGGRIHPEDLLFRLVAETVALTEDPGLPAEDQASLMTLEPADWVGALVELIRAGPGAPADADALARSATTGPEGEGEPLDPDGADVVAAGFAVALRGWRAAAMVDADDRLTPAGAWLLPRAACIGWDTDFDHPDDGFGEDGFGEDGFGEDGFGETGDLSHGPHTEEVAYLAEVAAIHDLDDRGLDALSFLLTLFESVDDGVLDRLDDAEVAFAAGAALLHPGVLEAFSTETLGIGRDDDVAAALDRITASVLPRVRGRDAAPVHHLAAKVAEVRGDAATGQAALDRALALDPDLPPALDDAAWYAEDRGEHVKVVTLLRRLGVPDDDPQLVRALHLAASRPRDTGRNDPCPCGSGRKFKACCLRHGGIPLDARVRSVFAKLDTYATRPAQRDRVLGVALAIGGDDDEAVARALQDPSTVRFALFDLGLIDGFLRERGQLLPADERALVTSWSGTRLRTVEVVEVAPGGGMTVLDLVSGDRMDVDERTASHQLRVGACALVHLLPVAARWQLGSAMIVRPSRRDGIVQLLAEDATPDAVLAAIAAAVHRGGTAHRPAPGIDP